jgi:hypothetical protein
MWPGVSGKRKRTKRRTEPDNKAQSERFIEAAREIGADESGKDFEEALGKIVPKKPRS